MTSDWDQVLIESVQRFDKASDPLAYHLAVAEMVAHVGDTHATVNSQTLAGHWGSAAPGIQLRSVEGQPVVTAVFDDTSEVRVGDVLTAVDGEPVDTRMAYLSRYIAASTPQALRRDVLARLLTGPDGSVVTVSVSGPAGEGRQARLVRRRPGPEAHPPLRPEAVRVLPGNIGYLDLRRITRGEVDAAFETLRQTKGIVFDMRGYPRDTRFAVARWLASSERFAPIRIRRRVAMATGSAFQDLNLPSTLQLSARQHYPGSTVMLIDEHAQSQSEATGLLLRAVNGTRFVGSPTAGANGDGTAFYAPGGIYIGLTGQGVWLSDGGQLQRVGLIPDIEVTPTLRGVREGRDEVLERAIQVLGGR